MKKRVLSLIAILIIATLSFTDAEAVIPVMQELIRSSQKSILSWTGHLTPTTSEYMLPTSLDIMKKPDSR